MLLPTRHQLSLSAKVSQRDVSLMDLWANSKNQNLFQVIKGRLEEFLWNSGQAKNPAGLGGWSKGPDHA